MPSTKPNTAPPSAARMPRAAPAQAPQPAAPPKAKAKAKQEPAPRPPAKAGPKAAAKKPPKQAKPAKLPKNARLVRDSFTMPELDFALIATLKARALAGQRETKKSELLRAGLHALAAMDGPTLLAALRALAPVKVGRPKQAAARG